MNYKTMTNDDLGTIRANDDELQTAAEPVVPWRRLWVGTGLDDRELLGDWMSRAQELGNTILGLIVYDIDDGGGIKWWDGMFVFADGETPSDCTPDVKVDWTGFAEAVESCDPVKVVWRSC